MGRCTRYWGRPLIHFQHKTRSYLSRRVWKACTASERWVPRYISSLPEPMAFYWCSAGPLLEANWGDTFEITINNQITGPEEGTSFHWHGLFQHGTPWFDGIPAVDLCPIAPGKSFTYTFKADQYGTSWWHSHMDAQYVDGLFGPMVVYGFVSLPFTLL